MSLATTTTRSKCSPTGGTLQGRCWWQQRCWSGGTAMRSQASPAMEPLMTPWVLSCTNLVAGGLGSLSQTLVSGNTLASPKAAPTDRAREWLICRFRSSVYDFAHHPCNDLHSPLSLAILIYAAWVGLDGVFPTFPWAMWQTRR